MEFKKYFKKFGVGWIIIGMVFTIASIPSSFYYPYFFQEVKIILPILTASLFLLGFLGLFRIFELIILWLFIGIFFGVVLTVTHPNFTTFNNLILGMFTLLFIFLLVIFIVVGNFLDIKNYKRSHKN